MSYEPCENPNCKSCGRPHPNCRCYADGGFVSDADFKPDAAPSPDFIPDNQFKPDAVSASPDFVADKDFVPDQDDSEKYSSTGQMIKTGLEGAAQGLIGPLAPLIETKVMGVDPQDIAGRAKENPLTHGVAEAGTFAGSMFTGLGEAGLLAKGVGAAGKAAEVAAKAAELGKVGSTLLKGAVEGSALASSDEITKAILGKPDADHSIPVSNALLHVGAAGLMGAATGGLFTLGQGIIGKGLAAANGEKIANGVSKYLTDVGKSGDPLGKFGVTDKINQALTKGAAGAIGSKVGAITGNPYTGIATYEAAEKALSPMIEKLTGKPIGKANKYVAQAFIKGAMENQAAGVPNAIHYVNQVGKGLQKSLTGIEALFKAGGAQLAPDVSEGAAESLKQFIKDGQVDEQAKNQTQSDANAQQPFAHGGIVEDASQPADHFSAIFPEQSALLSAAKGRISGYLNNLRPADHPQKLAFDSNPPDTDKHRTYNKAIDIAVNPLKILDRVNKGNLTPEDMQHFVGLYPEVHSMLSQKMTERIMKAQAADEKPSYTKRQAMSLFLGAPLDSTLTPQSIQAAQGVYAMKKAAAQQQVPTKNKKGTSALSKVSENYQTAAQGRAERQQKQ